jgi:hypothetical protein
VGRGSLWSPSVARVVSSARLRIGTVGLTQICRRFSAASTVDAVIRLLLCSRHYENL